MAITTINQENFDDQVTRSSAPVLLDFWAAWCGPCSMLSPVVEELAEEHPEISFGKVNVDEAPELAQRYQISAHSHAPALPGWRTRGCLRGGKIQGRAGSVLEMIFSSS